MDIPFERLAESDLMIETFWSIPSLLLWNDMYQVLESETGSYEMIRCAPDHKLSARASLTKWPGTDRQMRLDDFIQSQTGLKEARGSGIRYWKDLHLPYLLRARWVREPAILEDPFKMTDMANLQLQRRGNVKAAYRLVAIVRLRATEADVDLFAAFSVDGHVVQCDSDTIFDTDMHGKTTYMLYYTRIGQIGNIERQRGMVHPPLTLPSIVPSREHVILRSILLEISSNAVQEEADQAELERKTRHGSMSPRPKTSSPPPQPQQRRLGLSSRGGPPGANAPLQPVQRQPKTSPSQSFQDLHVWQSFEGSSDQDIWDRRPPRGSSNTRGTKRSAGEDTGPENQKRHRASYFGVADSPPIVANERGHMISGRSDHAVAKVESIGEPIAQPTDPARQSSFPPVLWSNLMESVGDLSGIFGVSKHGTSGISSQTTHDTGNRNRSFENAGMNSESHMRYGSGLPSFQRQSGPDWREGEPYIHPSRRGWFQENTNRQLRSPEYRRPTQDRGGRQVREGRERGRGRGGSRCETPLDRRNDSWRWDQGY